MKITLLSLTLLLIFSCSLQDINHDQKHPESVPAGFLLSNATVGLFDFMASPIYRLNKFRVHSRHWAESFYREWSEEILVGASSFKVFERMYTEVLKDLNVARSEAENDNSLSDLEKLSYYGVLDVMEVFVYSFLVDLYGDIPYSEAFSADNTPAYDDAKQIYYDLIEKLEGAITILNSGVQIEGDLVYNGNPDSWRKFASSLKLKLAIRIADIDFSKAKSMAESAFDEGCFNSSADDFKLVFETEPPNTSPLWDHLVQERRSDFVCSRTLADAMNVTDDPRIPFYFKNNAEDGSAVGGVTGTANSYPANSQPGTKLEDPAWPCRIMTYSEVLFLMSDAAARGFELGEEAGEYYHRAIKNSILEWGGSVEDADDFISNEQVDYYTANGTWKQKIALQKWIALYDMGFEAWTTYRLYDWPELPSDMGWGTPVINRYIYSINELEVNQENVEAAILKMGGEDLLSNKIFWDIN